MIWAYLRYGRSLICNSYVLLLLYRICSLLLCSKLNPTTYINKKRIIFIRYMCIYKSCNLCNFLSISIWHLGGVLPGSSFYPTKNKKSVKNLVEIQNQIPGSTVVGRPKPCSHFIVTTYVCTHFRMRSAICRFVKMSTFFLHLVSVDQN